jgi:hypothetical protein
MTTEVQLTSLSSMLHADDVDNVVLNVDRKLLDCIDRKSLDCQLIGRELGHELGQELGRELGHELGRELGCELGHELGPVVAFSDLLELGADCTVLDDEFISETGSMTSCSKVTFFYDNLFNNKLVQRQLVQ